MISSCIDMVLVQLSQSMSERFHAFWQSILVFSGVLFLVWCVQWLLMHFAIRRKFRVIHQVSEQISNKSVNDLAPISMPEPELIGSSCEASAVKRCSATKAWSKRANKAFS